MNSFLTSKFFIRGGLFLILLPVPIKLYTFNNANLVPLPALIVYTRILCRVSLKEHMLSSLTSTDTICVVQYI